MIWNGTSSTVNEESCWRTKPSVTDRRIIESGIFAVALDAVDDCFNLIHVRQDFEVCGRWMTGSRLMVAFFGTVPEGEICLRRKKH